ncbi:hypothetical protein HOLleu_20077 [Holothuria leucospilota]|uniref:Death domain-containing protein n=1 Tax=Holothuria leucospilota TaxID=206669 RepID=A0A9Q1BZB8_HOLLE|nr:hypothetical protein HOLleu_20077 [Holothuria leucospilota]
MASITQKPGLKKGTTTKLRHPIMLEPTNSYNLLLTTKDKLVIIFRHLEKYVVYRKSDSTVAVITNPDFKTKNPPITYDGCLMEEMFGNVQLSLMYAVAMFSHESAEIQLKPKDIILVLAQAGENYLLGITSANMVGCFPSEKVVLLTMPRPFLHPGLMIKVKARLKLILEDITILPGEMYNIIKGKDDPFDWRLLISQRRVPLGFFIEEEIKVHILPSPHKDEDSTSQTVQKDPSGTPDNENDDTVQMEQKKYCPQYDTIQGKNQYDILYRPNEQKVEHDYVNGPKAYHNREDIQESINQLSVYRNVPINDELRSTIAQYVDDKVWHELGTKIGVPKQRCREIESQKETVYEKIYDLLGIWHEELKSNAKVGVLLDALVDVNPKDLHLILEDILRIVKDEQNRDPNQSIYENKRNIDDTNQDMGATSYDSQEQAQFEMKNELAQLREFHIRRTQLEMEDLLVKLRHFHNIPVNEALRKILAEYMEPDVWHQFGERIRIPITERIKIETEKYDIYEMTYDLLGNWLNKYESTATLGVLLDALVDVNPKHLNLLLKDILAEVEDCLDDSYQEIPEDETIYGTSRPNEAPYDKADESDVFGSKNGNLCYNDGPKEVNNALYELGEGNGFNRENLYYNDDSYEFKGANEITFGARTELRLDFSHHQIFDVQETEYAKENGKTFFFRTKGTKCLNASSLISKDGGEIEIPAAGVKLQIPAESFEEDHFLTLKILPSLSYKGPGSSFEDNSTVMVEILPNNLTLKQPAKLTLPHCLILKEPKRCPVKIFHSHHCAGINLQIGKI